MAEPMLKGIVVLDLSRLLPGPFCTMILSDLGATVIKVEDTGAGDYMRQLPPARSELNGRFGAVNRDKRSVAIDLKNPAGRAAFLRMVAKADVVIESFRPGVMDKLGVGFAALREANPGIILLSISGYGQTGPYRERAGHDLNYIALAGVLTMGGARGGAPALPGIQIADFAGGGLWGAVGVLAALASRARGDREARHLDLSMTEGAMALLAAEIGNYDASGKPPRRSEETLNGGLACYGVFECKDGKWFSVGALEPKFWLGFNAAIGRAGDMSEILRDGAGQDAIRAEIAAILKTRTRDEWTTHFKAHDVCCEPILEVEELTSHPLHAARGNFFQLGGRLQTRTPFGGPDGHTEPPRHGQHTAEVLAELGFSADEISALRAAKATL